MTLETMLFFQKAPGLLPLYEAVESAILTRCPGTDILVQKSQIAFTVKRRFAFVSLRGQRLIVTFGLRERVMSPRVLQAVEPYPGRWTHHVWVRTAEEVDGELLGWIETAWLLAGR